MDIHRGERLTVKVRLLGQPCLWCWEIVDTADGALIESSWATDWTAYGSSREAMRAGLPRSRASRASLRHVARPIPLAAPVTSTLIAHPP